MKFLILCVFELFCGAIFHNELPPGVFGGNFALYWYFGILFPASDILRHIKFDFFVHKFFHLALNWIIVSWFNKISGINNHSHFFIVDVISGGTSHNFKIRPEKVQPMRSGFATVINYKLKNHLFCAIAKDRYVLSVASNYVSVISESLLGSSILGTLMGDCALLADLSGMYLWAHSHLIWPFYLINWELILEKFDCILNCFGPFFGHNSWSAI